MPKLLPTRLVADILEVSFSRVSQLAKARNITPTVIAGRRLWTEQQVSDLRPKKNGRPRKAKQAGKESDQ